MQMINEKQARSKIILEINTRGGVTACSNTGVQQLQEGAGSVTLVIHEVSQWNWFKQLNAAERRGPPYSLQLHVPIPPPALDRLGPPVMSQHMSTATLSGQTEANTLKEAGQHMDKPKSGKGVAGKPLLTVAVIVSYW